MSFVTRKTLCYRTRGQELKLFVLQPAVELVPDVVWPNTGKTLQQLLDELETDEHVIPLPTRPPFYVA